MATRYQRRARGEGAVYPTAEGRWRGSYLVPSPDGGQVRRVVSGRNKAEVIRKLDALKRDAAAGIATAETTGAYLARWVEAIRPSLRPSTHREYARHVRMYWLPAVGTIPLDRLTPAHVEALMAELLGRGLSPTTARYARTTLRRALHDAQRDGLLIRNVASLARPPRVERKEMHVLSAVEVRTLLDATVDHRFGPLYALLVGSGLRLGEALGLTWSDVDLEVRSLVVRRSLQRDAGTGYVLGEPKTSKSRRTVMLPAIAVEALRRQLDRQTVATDAVGTAWQDRIGLCFTDAVGRTLSPTVVSADFREVVDGLGLPIRLHDLRHTNASLLLGAGVPLKVVSEALGHTSIAVTGDIYSHVTPALAREAADGLDRALR